MIIRAYAAKTACLALGCAALTSTSTLSATELELNRLNACKDLSELLISLKRPATSCRTATGTIEQTIHSAARNDATLCFLESPPVASLSDFKCIQISHQGWRTTACFRPMSASLLSDYKTNYVPKFSSRVAGYLEEAKRCPGSNGDASRTIDTTFPTILMPVAEHEFGFNVQFGDTKPGTSIVSHGFARTSPQVSKSGPVAIEYVVFATGMTEELTARTSLGNWRLRVDTSPEFAAPFLKAIKRQGLDAYLAFFAIDMERAPRASVPPKVPSLPDELSDVVVSRLEVEGFEEMNDVALKRHTGQTRTEVTETLLKGVSFGARKLTSFWKPSIRILMKTSGLSCTQNGQGAIGAYLFSLNGEEGVQVDFGSISAMVLGIGACASPSAFSREYVRNLARESKQAVLDKLVAR